MSVRVRIRRFRFHCPWCSLIFSLRQAAGLMARRLFLQATVRLAPKQRRCRPFRAGQPFGIWRAFCPFEARGRAPSGVCAGLRAAGAGRGGLPSSASGFLAKKSATTSLVPLASREGRNYGPAPFRWTGRSAPASQCDFRIATALFTKEKTPWASSPMRSAE